MQLGVWLPRFSIHSSSWKAGDGQDATNEPWMFPEKLGAVRAALRLRCRLKVALESLFHESAATGVPVCRPLLLHYWRDARARAQNFCWMFGRDVLVAPVVDPGPARARVYLPVQAGASQWLDLRSRRWHHGGGTVECDGGGGEFGVPVFVREGRGLVLSGEAFRGRHHVGKDERVVLAAVNGEQRAGTALVLWTEVHDVAPFAAVRFEVHVRAGRARCLARPDGGGSARPAFVAFDRVCVQMVGLGKDAGEQVVPVEWPDAAKL